MKKIYILFLSLAILSCEGNTIEYDTDNLLLGNWKQASFNDGLATFNRTSSLPNDSYGIAFMQDGVFKEKTSGFCGTPPITYFEVSGSFTLIDNFISIEKESYPMFVGYEIVNLSENILELRREVSHQEKDFLALMDLFYEIEQIAYSKNCSDSSLWKITAYGSKACGGPQGYLPYSTEIDTVDFLNKVAAYTAAEDAFNKKWNIISDCSLAPSPNRVECNNGFPSLIYN